MREDYKLTVNVKLSGKDYKINLEYKQATIKETIDFLNLLEEGKSIDEWVIEFVKDHTKSTTMKSFESWLLHIDEELRNKIWGKVKDTRFAWTFGSKDGGGDEWHPYYYVLTTLCDKYSIDPERFQNNYTIEQLSYLWEGVVYSANEQAGEEWRKANERMRFDKQHSDDELLDLIS